MDSIWHEKIYQVYTKNNFFNLEYTRYIQIYLFLKKQIWHGYDMDMTFAKKYTWCCNIHVISMGYDIKWGVCERVWVSRRAGPPPPLPPRYSEPDSVGPSRSSRLSPAWHWQAGLRRNLPATLGCSQPEPALPAAVSEHCATDSWLGLTVTVAWHGLWWLAEID